MTTLYAMDSQTVIIKTICCETYATPDTDTLGVCVVRQHVI